MSRLCRKRNTACELRCGVSLRYELMISHIANDCPNRGLTCKLCKEVVLAKDMPLHLERCDFR